MLYIHRQDRPTVARCYGLPKQPPQLQSPNRHVSDVRPDEPLQYTTFFPGRYDMIENPVTLLFHVPVHIPCPPGTFRTMV